VCYDGLEILGFPVGSDEFIAAYLGDKAAKVLLILDKIQDCVTQGVWDSSWACPQGLYQMLRDCVGHMLRHLPKAVRPVLIRDGLWEVDLRIQMTFARICGI
jgi:hypothetical protein